MSCSERAGKACGLIQFAEASKHSILEAKEIFDESRFVAITRFDCTRNVDPWKNALRFQGIDFKIQRGSVCQQCYLLVRKKMFVDASMQLGHPDAEPIENIY
jgi:hypothetical protein